MAIRGLKKSGWAQGIYEINATKKERIGTLRILQDGRKFRYARAGGTALAIGLLTSTPAEIPANVLDELVGAGNGSVANDPVINFTAGGNVTYAENYFEGGFYNVQDATGEGQIRGIESSTVVTSGTEILVSLDHPLLTQVVAAVSYHTLMSSPFMGVIKTAGATDDFHITGLPVVNSVTGNYYYWSQTEGFCSACDDEQTEAGEALVADATDAGEFVLASGFGEMQIGYNGPVVGAAASDYPLIYLTLE